MPGESKSLCLVTGTIPTVGGDCQELSSVSEAQSYPTRAIAPGWQKEGTDLFEWKKSTYLLVVDYSRLIG